MAEEAKEVREEKKGKPKLILLIPVLFILLAGAAGAYFFIFSKKDKKGEEAPLPSRVGVMMEIGTFTVNLADRDVDAYARVSITLELSDEKVR
ncbi:MAG: flagellar basal body-associated protein FliL [Aquificaceae bacterium]